MKEIVKIVIVRGRHGNSSHRALIDTGTDRVIMPRRIAEQAGIPWGGRTADIRIAGDEIEMEIRRGDIEIANSGCRATVEILVPIEKEDARPEFIIGSLFLQKTKAAIIYMDDHPVLHVPGKLHFVSRGGGARANVHDEGPKADRSPMKKRPSITRRKAK